MAAGSDFNILEGLDYNKTDKKDPDDDFFVKFPFKAIDNQRFRELNASPITFLIYLCRHIVRKPMKDGLKIYERYYKNNHLACSFTQEYLANKFNVSERTIRRWTKQLEKDGVLRVDRLIFDKKHKRSVYITGTHVKYDFCFFMQEIYT